MLDSITFEFAAQEARVQVGIKVVGIAGLRVVKQATLVFTRSRGTQAVIVQIRLHSAPQAFQPEVVKRTHQRALTGETERVDIALTRADPVFERDRQFEGASHFTQELLFVDIEKPMEGPDRRHRGFTHADGADFRRLDQGNVQRLAKLEGQRTCGKPTRRAAAGNHDLAYPVLFHVSISTHSSCFCLPAAAGHPVFCAASTCPPLAAACTASVSRKPRSAACLVHRLSLSINMARSCRALASSIGPSTLRADSGRCAPARSAGPKT